METHIVSSADQHAHYFKTFVRCLADKFQPLKLFCFAKTIIITDTDGGFKESGSTYQCNYCLLMVTESQTRIDYEVQDYTNFHYKHGTICILCHSQDSITEAIKANNKFFKTVYTSAQLLYSHDGMSNLDFTQNFIPTQAAKKALKHLEHRMPLAEGFLRGASECLNKHDFSVSTFLLHQVVEQCCIVLIRVHIAYRSEIHNLLRMLRLCSSFSDRPLRTFLTGSPDDERLFNILMKSYSGTRYAPNFSVNESDAKRLFDRISNFALLVVEMCDMKIEQLEQEALLYIEHSAGREVEVD